MAKHILRFNNLSSALDRIDRVILKYKFHPNIISIKQNIRHIEKFSCRFVTLEDASRLIIKYLKNNKETARDISLKLLKEYEFSYTKLTNCINNSISEALFPDSLKRANINPVHKKNEMGRITDEQVYCQLSLKFMKRLYLISRLSKCKIF